MKRLSEMSAATLDAYSDKEIFEQIVAEVGAGVGSLTEHLQYARNAQQVKLISDMYGEREAEPPPKPEPKIAESNLARQPSAGPSVSGSYFRDRLLKIIRAEAVKALPAPAPTVPDAVITQLSRVADAGKAAGVEYRHEDEPALSKSVAVPTAPKPAVAPEVKKRALVKFNPIRNPYSQNGFENARIALDQMEFDCALDLFHNKPVIKGEHAWLGGDGFEDLDNVVLKLRQLILDEFNFDPRAGMFDALKARCLDHAFDPLLDYLDSLRWDGKSRLDSWLIDYATADDTPLNRAFGRKVLIAAVRRARRPGCKFDYLLVLEGAQGIGKSTAVLILAGEDFYSNKAIIGCDTREQQESIQGVWIYEIPELQGLSKVDMNWMKMFLSRTHDKARPAFARAVVDRPRRGVFIGTTNDDTYLRDTTGNRRWWPVKLYGRIDLSALERDRDQLWAEAVAAEAMGEGLVIPENLWDAAAIEQHARMEVDAWEEPIANHLRKLETKRAYVEGCLSSKDADKNCVPEFRVSSAYLLGTVLGIVESYRGQRESKRLADVMRSLGWKLAQYPIKVGRKTCRAYTKPQPQKT